MSLCLLLGSLALGAQPAGTAQVSSAAQDDDAVYAQELLKKGDKAPAFSIADLDGKVHSLSEFDGKYVVLDFWASWCPDCRKDIPELKRLKKIYGNRRVAFVSISLDHDYAAWQRCVSENGMDWLQLSERVKRKDSRVADDYKVRWIPSVYVIGPDGKVILGTVMLSKVEKALKSIR